MEEGWRRRPRPPLLAVADPDRIVAYTHSTGTVSAAHELVLDRLDEPRSLELLRAVFHDPESRRRQATLVMCEELRPWTFGVHCHPFRPTISGMGPSGSRL